MLDHFLTYAINLTETVINWQTRN